MLFFFNILFRIWVLVCETGLSDLESDRIQDPNGNQLYSPLKNNKIYEKALLSDTIKRLPFPNERAISLLFERVSHLRFEKRGLRIRFEVIRSRSNGSLHRGCFRDGFRDLGNRRSVWMDQTVISLRPGGGGGRPRLFAPRFDVSALGAETTGFRTHGGVGAELQIKVREKLGGFGSRVDSFLFLIFYFQWIW